MIRAAIVGATGYTGRETARLLQRHPEVADVVLVSAREGGEPEPVPFPGTGTVLPFDRAHLRGCQAVFLCAPHGFAIKLARELVTPGRTVVDLSPDFRLKDPEAYRQNYGHAHSEPALLRDAVYGLTERARPRLRAAALVANPGCYPTSVLLPLAPLIDARALEPSAPIVADSKSGVSGAGKEPTATTHFGAVHENFKAYGVGTHRHLAEIHQEAGTRAIAFVPHLLPVFRGILSTIYVRPAAGHTPASIRQLLAETYTGEPFVRVLPEGKYPETAQVHRTNLCLIGVGECAGATVLVSAIDNLVKGAAGQAVQNLNVALGFPETAGLTEGVLA